MESLSGFVSALYFLMSISQLSLFLILSGKLERTNPTWRQRLKRRLQRIKRRILG